MTKTIVTLDGVPIAGSSPFSWRITAGTAPYTTVVTVHDSDRERLAGRRGMPLTLSVTDTRGVTVEIKHVYVLHEVPSDSNARASFVIADRRWKWPYRLVARDYNIPRKTGSRTAFGIVPETRTYVDDYDYLPYSIDNGKRWTARAALEDVLRVVEPSGEFVIESLPIKDGSGGEDGQFTLQNVMLRDAGDAALGRLLSYIPGADLYVDPDGRVVIYDATDLSAAERHLASLPKLSRAGEAHVIVNRAAVRPSKVQVFYQREIEALLEFDDDWNTSSSSPDRDAPFFENVVATVDLTTRITEQDPETGASVEKTCPPGTWVRFDRWLEAVDGDRPSGSAPWTFETIRKHWVTGIEAVLNPEGSDLDEDGVVASRVGAIRQHFRQTFRINPRYMRRIREVLAVRVALLDPVTGARAPAVVWGQACVIPNDKGARLGRTLYQNVDNTAESRVNGSPIVQTNFSPARVEMIDPALGVFRISWIDPPAGTVQTFVPSLLVSEGEQPKAISRDLADQDREPFGSGVRTEGAANGLFLSKTSHMRVLLTVIPVAPNDERQFHRIDVEAEQLAGIFRSELRLADGSGPPLQVFVPPGEMTARFAWGYDDATARATLRRVFGLEGGNEPLTELPGFVLANEGLEQQGPGGAGGRHLSAHSQALAAELIAAFADSVQGAVATIPDPDRLGLLGNMNGIAIRVAGYPSGMVDMVQSFPGQPRPVSRFAMLPDSTRQQVLGTLPFR